MPADSATQDAATRNLSAMAACFELEGEPRPVSGNHPLLFNDPDAVWLVESGLLEVFTVGFREGQPVGARSHFASIGPGQVVLGMDLDSYGQGSGFLATAPADTVLYRLSRRRFAEYAERSLYRTEVAALLDGWVESLSRAVTKDIAFQPKTDLLVTEESEETLGAGKCVRAKRGAAWVTVRGGDVSFIDLEDLLIGGEAVAFPVAPDTWLTADEETPMHVAPTVAALAADPAALWRGLDLFHETLCLCEFLNKKLIAVDEFNRLRSKADYQRAAKRSALREIASVLDARAADGAQSGGTTDAEDAVLSACRLIGKDLGVSIRSQTLAANRDMTTKDRVNAIARASRLRIREVGLRDDWWRRDQGPMLAYTAEEKDPVALLPDSPTAYTAVNPRTGTRQRVTQALAATLAPFADSFYRPFPSGKLTAGKLLRFGAHGLGREFRSVAIMGVAIGFLGTLTPYFTGQIFDQLIPGAERNRLVQVCVGLIFAALGGSIFTIVRGIAVLRVEGKMDYSVQAGLWDRLLNLPLTFFRDYSAGDLADRASGIDTIRSTLSGVGVTAILGSLTSVFYLVMLFKYNFTLATTAIGLVAGTVLVTIICNILQLRHQRGQFKIQGRITGLVLQLITGIGKLRTAGAEDHAFRVWAQAFAEQKRIAYKIGTISNVSAVFNAGAPILTSIVIFATLASIQASGAANGAAAGFSTGDFLAFNAAFGAFLSAMLALSSSSLQMLAIVPIYERLKPILLMEPEVQADRAFPDTLKGEIEIYHVQFRYKPDGPLIIKDVTIHIKAGEFVAFVGGSGCGKSTMLRLLMGFETPEAGTISYDGQDLAKLDLREVRQQIGVVLQTSRLMPTDIFHNIIGTFPLGIEAAWEAAKMAGMEDDVKGMPMGMHTVISEGGGAFSGGQKQRLMIARAIVNRPRIIFFDEATSALDNRTQKQVSDSLDKMQATRIVIAHRLSTIINADRIIVFDAGQVVQSGTYQELVDQPGHFQELARRQIV